jgi:hypothetical protein
MIKRMIMYVDDTATNPEAKQPKTKPRIISMLQNIGVIGVSLLTFVVINSPAVAIDTDKETGDDANGVPIGLFLSDQAARPDNPALRISRSVVDHVDDWLRNSNSAVTAGMASSNGVVQVSPAPAPANEWFARPSVFSEYDYINSADQRPNGADSRTHSETLGVSFFTKYDIQLGLTYQYSHREEGVSNANLPTKEDSNFISLYLDKSFLPWLNIGVSGGYGYTQTSLLGWDTGNENTWNVSPFFVLWHNWGAFSASLNTFYQYAWTNVYSTFPGTVGAGSDNETGRVVVALGLGYAVTEKLTVQATAAYTGITNDESTSQNLPEARNWATFGTKLTYRAIGQFNVYVGYAYDAFNSSYRNQNVQAGLSYSW